MRSSVVITLITAILFTCSSCSQLKDIKQDDPFRKLYAFSSEHVETEKKGVAVYPSLTLSCFKMPLSVFCRILSDKFLIGLVYSEALQDKTITAEFKNTDLLSVLNIVSRCLSVDVVRVGNSYFLGSLRSDDRAIFYSRVLGFDQSSLDQVLKSVVSEKGKLTVFPDGLLVVTDTEPGIMRVSEVVSYLQTRDTATWIVQLCFVSLRKDALLEAGLGVKSSGTVSYNIADSRLDFKDFSLDGLFNLSSSSNFADVYASPMFLLREGSKTRWQDGQKVPIPRRTVSAEGTVSTTGYDYINTGFIVDAVVYQSKRGGRLKLEIELSDIKSYVEESPLTSVSSYSFDADLELFRPYLIGELTFFKSLDTQKQVLTLGSDKGKTVLQVWAQLYKISGPSRETFSLHNTKTFIGQKKVDNTFPRSTVPIREDRAKKR